MAVYIFQGFDRSARCNTAMHGDFHAIGAALRNEQEPIRSMGVVMDQAN